jgi:prophage regulatory protein
MLTAFQEKPMATTKTIDESPYMLPATGFVRQRQLETILPFSRTTLWRRIKDGSFPSPVKLSPGCTAWRVEEVRAWMGPVYSSQVSPLPAADSVPTFALGGGRQEAASTVQQRPRASEDRAATAVEKKLTRQLIIEATAWRESDTLRAYITHLLGAVVASGGKPSSELSAWLVRAAQVADRLDPTQTRIADTSVEHIRSGTPESE